MSKISPCPMNMISFLGFKGLLNKQLLFSERVALEKEFYEWCETALENGDKGTHSGIWDNQKQYNIGIGDELWIGEVVAMLNEGVALAEENKELKLQLEAFKDKLCELGVSDVKLYGKRYYTGLEEWLND